MRSRATRRLGMDLMALLFLSMGAILYLLLPLIAIPEKKEATEQAPPPQGNLMVELYWPDELRADIDLWVKAPGDNPVGYSNKGAVFFNLLRDDLGEESDVSGRNMELSYSRGIPDGEYIVNVHLFHVDESPVPIPVRIIVATKLDETAGYVQLFTVTGELTHEKQEKTMARFKMKDGYYVEGSFHTRPTPIRSPDGGEL